MKKTHHPSTHGLKPRLWCCRPARERGFHSSITGWVETWINLFLEFFFCMFLPIRRWHRWFGLFSSCRNSSLVLHFDDGNRPTSKRWPFFFVDYQRLTILIRFQTASTKRCARSYPGGLGRPENDLQMVGVPHLCLVQTWILFSISYMEYHPSHSFIFFREVGIPPTRKTFAGGDQTSHLDQWSLDISILPSGYVKIAIENGHLYWIYPLKLVIFHMLIYQRVHKK